MAAILALAAIALITLLIHEFFASGRLQAHFKQQLDHSSELNQACFTANVKVRVTAGGTIDIQDVKLQKSTGDRELDARIRAAFAQLMPMEGSPPPDMPWPITLQVVSRRADCKSERPNMAEQNTGRLR